MREWGFATRAIHRTRVEEASRPVVTPIYQTSTFAFEDAEEGMARFAGTEAGYVYTRLGNPTVADLEARLAALEGAEACLATASGMAAISTALVTLLSKGDHVVADPALYGCTVSLLREHLSRLGVQVTFADLSDVENLRRALRPSTKVVFFETPANPTMKLVDVRAVADVAHAAGAQVVVDNTFLTPYFQRPLELGADVVVHSATKYLGGHSDLLAGALLGRREFVARALPVLKDFGGILAPMNAFLLTRGLATLKLRMEAHDANARRVAEFLRDHPAVAAVHYPGLASFPQAELAARQQRGAGGVLAFELRGGLEAGKRFLNALRLGVRAVSLGGVETLVQHPASMTHSPVPREQRLAAGITDGLVRVSVGLEEVEDVLRDFGQALERASAPAWKRLLVRSG